MWNSKRTRAVGESLWKPLLAVVGTSTVALMRAARRPAEVIFGLTAGGFLGWTAAYYAVTKAHRVDFWSPFAIVALVAAGVALIVWVVGEHHKNESVPTVINNNYYVMQGPSNEVPTAFTVSSEGPLARYRGGRLRIDGQTTEPPGGAR